MEVIANAIGSKVYQDKSGKMYIYHDLNPIKREHVECMALWLEGRKIKIDAYGKIFIVCMTKVATYGRQYEEYISLRPDLIEVWGEDYIDGIKTHLNIYLTHIANHYFNLPITSVRGVLNYRIYE